MVQETLKKLNSKKLWAYIIALITIIGTASTGETQWAKAVPQIVYLTLGYFGAEGIVDVSRARK